MLNSAEVRANSSWELAESKRAKTSLSKSQSASFVPYFEHILVDPCHQMFLGSNHGSSNPLDEMLFCLEISK